MIYVIVALAAAFLFGLGLVLTQIGMRDLDTQQGAATSVPSSAVMFIFLSPFALDLDAWNSGAAALFAVIGLLFPASVTLLVFGAARRVGANVVGALGSSTPFFAVAIAVLTIGEIPRIGQLVGMVTIIAGILVLFGLPTRTTADQRTFFVAMGLALTAALIRGGVMPIVKIGFADWPSPFAATLIAYIFSSMTVVSIGFLKHGWRTLYFNGSGRIKFVGVGLCNGLAMFLIYVGLNGGEVALIAPLIAMYPLMTIWISYLLLGKSSFSRDVLVATLITVAGATVLVSS